jgi:hypothetical protein
MMNVIVSKNGKGFFVEFVGGEIYGLSFSLTKQEAIELTKGLAKPFESSEEAWRILREKKLLE